MDDFDVIIIGGSYAGLSAGMALGRALRKVLIIDSGQPCNRFTPYSHNFITHDGEAPAAISSKAKEQVLKYPNVQWHDGKATQAEQRGEGFVIVTDSGVTFSAAKILLATGVVDDLPELPGFAECWGKSILHCPYCHGYEVRGEQTGVLTNGEIAEDMAYLLSNWTDKLTIFTNGPSTIDAEVAVSLRKKGIDIIETQIMEVLHKDGALYSLSLASNETIPLKALYAHPIIRQHTDLAEKLGCELDTKGLIKVDNTQKTNVYGVYAAGDNSTLFRAVSIAVANGTMAGALLNREIVLERANS